MRGKKVKQLKKQPKVVIDIKIQVLNTGEILIESPPDPDLFHEVCTQAERIMKANYKKKENLALLVPDKRIVLAH